MALDVAQNLARAIEASAIGRSRVASVAVADVEGRANDWPEAHRLAARSAFNLPAGHISQAEIDTAYRIVARESGRFSTEED